MQKKIIALAIASALAAPAAFAADDTTPQGHVISKSELTIYGVADVSYDIINTGTAVTPATSGTSSKRVSSNQSRLGFKGAENLGDGLSVIWQIETLINIGNGGSAGTGLANRNTFAGLSSASLGTVVLGRHDTPYKISTRKFDQFADGIADNRSIMGGLTNVTAAATVAGVKGSAAASFDGRQDQVVAYISPKLGDMFTGAIGYVNLSPTENAAASAKTSAWSLAGMFDVAGGFYGALAYEVHDFAAATTGAKTKEKATKLGLGYTQNAFDVGFAYEKTSDNLTPVTGADLYGHNAYYLSGKYSFGNDAVKAAYTKAGNLANTVNTGASQFSLGYDHNLSKRTTLYALYTKLSNNSGAGYGLSTTSSVGGGSTLAGGTTVNSTSLGASPSAFAFGMKHTF